MSLAARGLTGFSFSSLLQKRGFYPELEDEEKILLVFSVGTTQTECDRLCSELRRLKPLLMQENQENRDRKPIRYPTGESMSEAAYSFDQINRAEPVKIPLQEAVGSLSAEMIIPYPPGIPVLLPGEVFTRDLVEQLDSFVSQGGNVRGMTTDEKKVYVLK